MHSKLLLLGSGDRAALELARSLGKRGIHISSVYFGEKTLCEYSRYCTKSYFLGNPQKDFTTFSRNLKSHILQNDYDYLIPINDHANEIVFAHSDFLSNHCTICAPDYEQYCYGHDKVKTVELCKELGIPYPQSHIISKLSDIEGLDLRFPLYAKPQFSSQLRGGVMHNYQVRKINSSDYLENFLRDNLDSCKVMLQEKIGGHGVGVNIASDHGVLVAHGITDRLHEPPNGGNSSYRKSIPMNDQLEGYTKKIIERLNWHGLAMLEFKYDGNDYYLMEINSRVWGSIGLSIFSGVDFPVLLLNLFANKKIPYSPAYKPFRYARNMYRDVHWNLQKAASGKIGTIIKDFALGFGRTITFKEKLDEYDIKDMKPFFHSIRLVARKYIGGLALRTAKKTVIRRNGITKIDSSQKIVFMCKGNINRSSFAQYYLSTEYDIASDSAGSLLRRSRLPSREAEITAREHFSIDLSAHRSRSIYDLDLDAYDFIIIFDDDNHEFLSHNFPELLYKVVYLKEGEEIKDPFSKDMKYFRERFATIVECIDQTVLAKHD